MNKFEHLTTTNPTLAEAKEVCKPFKRPLGHTVIIINSVAPTVTKGGIKISALAHKEAQNQVNTEGMLVVKSPFNREDKRDIENRVAVFEGEYVLFEKDSPAAFSRVVTSKVLLEGLVLKEGQETTPEMYKKYIVIGMSVHNFTCVLDPEYIK